MNIHKSVGNMLMTTDLSNREIAKISGVSHTTVNKYSKKLDISGLTREEFNNLSESEMAAIFNVGRTSSSKKRPINLPYYEKESRIKHMTEEVLYEEYYEIDPETAYGRTSFHNKLAKHKDKVKVVMRQIHKAGECVFVDFAGSTIPVRDVKNNITFAAQIFVAVLGCSNYTFAFAVKSQKLHDFIDAHNHMFQFFNGVPVFVITDNLKSAVTKAGKDPLSNRTYLEMCNHFGIIHTPTRPRHPRDNAKAENGVQFVTSWILLKLRHYTFFSIEDLNKAISDLLWKINEKPFKEIDGCRRSRYEELDKPELRPLPGSLFEYAEWTGKLKVPNDYHIKIADHYYSVPNRLSGSYIEARYTDKTVEILHDGKVEACHIRSFEKHGMTTSPQHLTKAHRAYAQFTPENMLTWAGKTGESTTEVVRHQFGEGVNVVRALRACSELKRLAKEHGTERLEKACKRAVSGKASLTLTSIKSILRRKLIDIDENDIPIQVNIPPHKNIRGPEYYSNKEK